MGKDEATGGCMSGMIHFLDFHHLLFTTSTGCTRTPKSSSPQNQHYSPQTSKGVEAPRNSLELDEDVGEDYCGIPYGVHLVSAPSSSTKKMKKQVPVWVEEEKMSSEVSTPRTPNVVARLMGLEIFPDAVSEPISSQYHSPINAKKKKKQQHCVEQESCRESPLPRLPLQRRDCNIRSETAGSRSLPESPRVSSERSRDAADPRRLSLQLNKENHNPASYLDDHDVILHKKDCIKINQLDGNKSPRSRYYAREILKQVKESISRRGGSDEYNLSKPRRSRIQADKIIINDASVDDHSAGRKYATARPSPSRSPPPPQEFHIPKPPLPPNKPSHLSRSYHLMEDHKEKILSSRKSKEAARYDRFNERIKKHTTPPPATVPPRNRGKNFTTSEQVHAPAYSSTLAINIEEQKMNRNESMDQSTSKERADPEYCYVRSVLDRAGSLPLDPFIFHQLELDLPLFLGPNIQHRCNRKLLFHLVEEILGEVLLSINVHQHENIINKEFLLGRLWRQIKGFPLAECRVIRDIDALVCSDLAESKVRRLLQHPWVVAETEVIVLEMERNLLQSVLGEAVTYFSSSSPAVQIRAWEE